MSATEMLNHASDPPNIHQRFSRGHNMFISGRIHVFGEEEDKYVGVDLEQDKIEFSSDDIEISVDIDSIIWTTKKLVCNSSIGVYLTLCYDGKARVIQKHDHALGQ